MSSDRKDDGPHLLTPKYHGQRGPLFENWKVAFLDACAGKGDNVASFAECFLGLDPQAGLNNAGIALRKVRRRESYSMLMRHLSDPSLSDVIRTEAGPNAVNPADRLNGRTAWQVLERECGDPTSTLNINVLILEWHSLSIAKDVGLSQSTMTDFDRLLVSKNSKLPVANRFSSDELTEKFLSGISSVGVGT